MEGLYGGSGNHDYDISIGGVVPKALPLAPPDRLSIPRLRNTSFSNSNYDFVLLSRLLLQDNIHG